MNSHDYSSHHSNLTDLGGEQLSSSASSIQSDVDARSDDSDGQGEEEPGQLSSIAGALYYNAESTRNPTVVSETPQNHPPPQMSERSTRGRRHDCLDL